jgi:para-aminobenzoate synthetase/4-amino-4-deoxychorismate lyase
VSDARTPFETFRVARGRIAFGATHLARLRRTCAALGVPLDEAALAAALAALPEVGVHRGRLEVTPDGTPSLALAPFTPPRRRGAGVPVAWADEVVDAGAWVRRHKTRDRAIYDRGMREAAARGLADLVYRNDRGTLAEGAVSTVFVRRGGVWWTPPVADGALPGVLRERLLRRGRVREGSLTPADVEAADDLAIGNALRGLRRVRFVSPDVRSDVPFDGSDSGPRS